MSDYVLFLYFSLYFYSIEGSFGSFQVPSPFIQYRKTDYFDMRRNQIVSERRSKTLLVTSDNLNLSSYNFYAWNVTSCTRDTHTKPPGPTASLLGLVRETRPIYNWQSYSHRNPGRDSTGKLKWNTRNSTGRYRPPIQRPSSYFEVERNEGRKLI